MGTLAAHATPQIFRANVFITRVSRVPNSCSYGQEPTIARAWRRRLITRDLPVRRWIPGSASQMHPEGVEIMPIRIFARFTIDVVCAVKLSLGSKSTPNMRISSAIGNGRFPSVGTRCYSRVLSLCSPLLRRRLPSSRSRERTCVTRPRRASG